jgi:hypothetical protein
MRPPHGSLGLASRRHALSISRPSIRRDQRAGRGLADAVAPKARRRGRTDSGLPSKDPERPGAFAATARTGDRRQPTPSGTPVGTRLGRTPPTPRAPPRAADPSGPAGWVRVRRLLRVRNSVGRIVPHATDRSESAMRRSWRVARGRLTRDAQGQAPRAHPAVARSRTPGSEGIGVFLKPY